MNRSLLSLALIGTLAVAVSACDKQNATPAAAAEAAAEAARNHAGHGVIKGFQSNNKVVVIDHQAIPGLMEAMTMAFELKDASLAAGLKPGDKVDFNLNVSGEDWTITALTKVK